MGRLGHLSSTSAENITDTFSCETGVFNKEKYVDSRSKFIPDRWKGKQFSSQTPHRPASASGIRGTLSQDCLFEPSFLRQFEKCGYAGDNRKPGYLLGRDAYTNTIDTERLRETLRKEERVVAKNMPAENEKAMRRLSRAQTPEEMQMRKKVSSRKYRPTSVRLASEIPTIRRFLSCVWWAQASSIGTKLDMAAPLNPQSYTKALGFFPAAYMCPHAHRRSALTGSNFFKSVR
jgi:hypothetical protein